MKKFFKAAAAIMLTMAMLFATGCGKEDYPNNGGDNGGGASPSSEGIYLGIIGFNQNQYEKAIGLLNTSTKSSFISFIDEFQMENLTGLYYADYLALQRMQSCGEPPQLANVAMVTFTDGLDNTSVSPATPNLNPEHYTSKEAYLEALNSKIKNDKVHGLSISAYSIGLKGTDALSNLEEFRHNLHMLASKEDNEYEAEDMDQAVQNFADIAESLYSETATASLKLLLPGGYEDGLDMRFTFDGSSVPENSSLFIDCKYRNLGTAIRLENISYHGFEDGEPTMESKEVEDGFMKFIFVDLTKMNGDLISESDKDLLQVYKKTTTSWGLDSEFNKDQQSHVISEQRSAIIMLVLDCTTSLGADSFNRMKEAAKGFVETLVSSTGNGNGGGNNGGGNNGGGSGNGTCNGHDYVDLGLPSGTLWATCNVGATTPEDYGKYFAWGETTAKTTYNWSTYKYCNGGYDQLTKYCNQSSYGYNGFTDNLTNIQPTDDAASANWGDGWRMPTSEQWEELYYNTINQWTIQSGVYGRLFTASNGSSLFLPAAGYRLDGGLYDAGSYGGYWSSSLYTGGPCNAWYFRFGSGYGMDHYSRRYGRSVRAVRSAR